MRILMCLLIAFAFATTGALVATAGMTAKINEALAACQLGLSIASTIFGTILLINFKDV